MDIGLSGKNCGNPIKKGNQSGRSSGGSSFSGQERPGGSTSRIRGHGSYIASKKAKKGQKEAKKGHKEATLVSKSSPGGSADPPDPLLNPPLVVTCRYCALL